MPTCSMRDLTRECKRERPNSDPSLFLSSPHIMYLMTIRISFSFSETSHLAIHTWRILQALLLYERSYPRVQEGCANWGFPDQLEAHADLAADANMWEEKRKENLTHG
jgi:hypothetical protein